MKTHRLAWLLLRGPIPDGAMVLHKCDNPPCFNPVHLYLGDAAMNARDASERGLLRGGQCKGQQQPQSKLTDVAVRDIRRLRPSTSLRALANKYGVSKKAILRVTNGTGWRHVS